MQIVAILPPVPTLMAATTGCEHLDLLAKLVNKFSYEKASRQLQSGPSSDKIYHLLLKS
ncbi:MAG: hypothetical protein HW386_358 [Gammaproteobacteria bacterium]|nr:hypothetical protein [Gammaproteobacteria bacterium]